ncbi:MAG: sulfatase-like hydrolase/transferase [Planctomycetota bacterium]
MANTNQPNIILIMSDQHSPCVLGSAGNRIIQTPNLDRLALSGMFFDHAYCASPVCVPSRMAFLTSQHCSDIRVWSNNCFLSSHIPTFVHSLGAAGYETVISGRMHFVGPDQSHGFEKRICGALYGSAHDSPKWESGPIPRTTINSKRIAIEVAGPGDTTFLAFDEDVAKAGCEYLRRYNGRRPFFLTVGFFLPHHPFICRGEDYEYYKGKITMPETPKGYFENLPPVLQDYTKKAHGFDPDSLTDKEILRARTAYYGMVTHMDRLCGEVLEALESSGQTQNTVVIYVSDHGEMLGDRKLWWKWSFLEASVRVPLIISWPERLPSNTRIPEIISLLDIGPTLIDIAGGEQLPNAIGNSMRSVLFDEPSRSSWPNEAIAEISDKGDIPPGRMIRKGPWKLVKYHGHKPLLYNLEENPEEIYDRAEVPENKAIVRNLLEQVQKGWDGELILRACNRNKKDLAVLAKYYNKVRPAEPFRWHSSKAHNVHPVLD